MNPMRANAVSILWVLPLLPLGASHARAGAPAPSDPVAGLLDPSADVRAAAAKRIGSGDLVAAAPAIPVLAEALDARQPRSRTRFGRS